MLRLALWGLMIVAAAGVLAAVILFVARLIMFLLGAMIALGAIWLVARLMFRKLR